MHLTALHEAAVDFEAANGLALLPPTGDGGNWIVRFPV
jgi:hypothetical protein